MIAQGADRVIGQRMVENVYVVTHDRVMSCPKMDAILIMVQFL
jgi:hypothetical protein